MTGKRFTPERVGKRPSDSILLLLIIVILGIGVAVLFSASYYYGGKKFDDPYHFFSRQLVFVGIGTLLAVVAANVSRALIRSYIPHLLLLTVTLLLLTFVPGIGQRIMGANRWIIIGGLSFQPSELAKLALILYLSVILSKKRDRLDDVINSLLPPLLILGLCGSLIYLQNDFSTAFFVLLIGLLMFFIAGVPLRYFLFLFFTFVPLAGILIFTKEHRVRRLITFLNPQSDPTGTGYQVIAANSALRRGDVWGEGFGMGTEKLGGLPEAHSDFIFAVFAEEAGFLGVVLAIGFFVAFAVRGYAVALRFQEDRFGFLLAFGLTSCILYQALVNMAVVSGLLPATGLPLPFFSHGGSAMVVVLIMCGLLLNLSRGPEGRIRYPGAAYE
jgi:cell division protein FtsW